MSRNIILVLHPSRKEARNLANEIVPKLSEKGFSITTASEGIAGVESLKEAVATRSLRETEQLQLLLSSELITFGSPAASVREGVK